MLKINQSAPEFSLPDQDGTIHSLSQYRGKWIFLYFYPKDNTPGCTVEACSIRDHWQDFSTAGITVLGVSADSQQSHIKFVSQHKLPFPVLSDVEKTMISAYDALSEKSMFGKKFIGITRISYLINPDGKIAHVYPKVNPLNHVSEVLRDIATAQTR